MLPTGSLMASIFLVFCAPPLETLLLYQDLSFEM